MNLIGDGRSEPRQSSPHRTAVKFVYLNSELLIRLGLARLSATACLTVVFSPYFLRAPEVEEFKREKPTSHTHLSLKTFLVSRGNMGSTLALRHFPSRSDFEKPCLIPAILPLALAVSLVRISSPCVTRIQITSCQIESEVRTRPVFFSYSSHAYAFVDFGSCSSGMQRPRETQHDHVPLR